MLVCKARMALASVLRLSNTCVREQHSSDFKEQEAQKKGFLGQQFFKKGLYRGLTVFSSKTSKCFIVSHCCYLATPRSCVPMWEHTFESEAAAGCACAAESRRASEGRWEGARQRDALDAPWVEAKEEQSASTSCSAASLGSSCLAQPDANSG